LPPEHLFDSIETEQTLFREGMQLAQQQELNWIEFHEKFSTEEACRDYLYRMRWPNGFNCPACGYNRAYKIAKRHLYECTECGYQASVTAGTIMHKTRTSLKIWFWIIYLMANDKRGTSATQLSQQFGISYPTAWMMMHKIRKAMGNRDSQYTLAGLVEMDDTLIGAPTEGGKRGRGTEKTKVVASLSLTNSGNPVYLKMNVVDDLKSTTIVEVANKTITTGAKVSTDLYRSYNQLSREGYTHSPKEFNYENNPDHLKWLHTIISNAKAFIAGTYHGLEPKHLQAYLDEYCYRFNRRMFKGQLFNRLLNACVSTTTVTFAEIVSKAA